MQLYYVPRTRANRARWMLEELGVPYQLERLDVGARQNREPPYLALNPFGHVPTLVDDGAVVFESAAICLYLADRFPDKGLAPPAGTTLRGAYYQWVMFSVVTMEREIVAWNEHAIKTPEAERNPAVVARIDGELTAIGSVLERALEGKEFLVGDRFTTADLLVASMTGWGRLMGRFQELPALIEHSRRMFARPAARKARED